MNRKGTKFNRRRVRPKTEAVKKEGARWLLRHSVIFARVHEHLQRKKGKFFTMKAKLTRFFVDNIEPKITSLKAEAARFKQWLAGRWTTVKTEAIQARHQSRHWLARHRRSLWVMAIFAVVLVVMTSLVYLWQRSPVFRATVKTLGVATVSILVTLWALLKGLGLTMREGLNGLGGGLASLGSGVLDLLRLLWSRLTKPVIGVIVVTNSTGDTVPIPPVDGRL